MSVSEELLMELNILKEKFIEESKQYENDLYSAGDLWNIALSSALCGEGNIDY